MDIKTIILITITLLMSVTGLPRSFKKNKRSCSGSEDCDKEEQCVHKICKQTANDDVINNTIIRERFCVTSRDCGSTYTCNKETHRCQQITNINEIMEKQSCKHVFKQFCLTSKHCGCNKEEMVCEENECVYKKENDEKQNLEEKCIFHMDCPVAFFCENEKCREARTMQELRIILMQPDEKCQVDGDCDKTKSETCHHGKCKKIKTEKRKSKRKLIKKCIKNTIDTSCKTSAECNSKCGKRLHKMTCTMNKCKKKKKKKSKKNKESSNTRLLKTFRVDRSR